VLEDADVDRIVTSTGADPHTLVTIWLGDADEVLAEQTEPLIGPGWPDEGETFPVRGCLSVVLNKEWHHRLFVERDLAVLENKG
jgi:hypothetical protein